MVGETVSLPFYVLVLKLLVFSNLQRLVWCFTAVTVYFTCSGFYFLKAKAIYFVATLLFLFSVESIVIMLVLHDQICSRIRSSSERDAVFEKLFIKKDANSGESLSHLFIDSAVYTRNRCFRLALSSKAGKKSFLLPTGRFKCKDLVSFTS